MLRYVVPLSIAGLVFAWPPARSVGLRFAELSNGTIASAARVTLENESPAPRHYSISLREPGVKLRSQPRWEVEAGKSLQIPLYVEVPRSSFVNGRRTIYVYVDDSAGFHRVVAVTVPGPES